MMKRRIPRQKTGRILPAFLSILLSFVTVLGLMPGMRTTAYAEELEPWSQDMNFRTSERFGGVLRILNNITVTISEGKTVTVEGAINTEGHTLTVSGKGQLIVKGYNGYGAGARGSNAINGHINVKGATVTVIGGNGPGFLCIR